MPFVLGAGSRKELTGVHPKLISVVERAIKLTTQDFSVHDGLRTQEEQQALVSRGASKTMKSKHRAQAGDGYGHAVDLVPFINGKLRWEWGAIWPIASAVHKAAAAEGVSLIWGAVWDRKMSQYDGTIVGLKAAVEAYKVRHPGPDFLDGPHFQIA
jgi:peptidoglycan L-alanyl-D-glutamate endopeptidase CwlK